MQVVCTYPPTPSMPHAGLSGAQDIHYETKEQRERGVQALGQTSTRSVQVQCDLGRSWEGLAWVLPIYLQVLVDT